MVQGELIQQKFSIVIICKNEAAVIEKVLQSVISVSDDILIYDTGSTDGTLELVKQYPVRLLCGEWLGYGRTKQAAINLAVHDWVLSIDADEALDETLQHTLQHIQLRDGSVYQFRFKNFLGDKWLRYGEWGVDKHIRLFNRKVVQWNNADIHEQLVIPSSITTQKVPGYILHYTVADLKEYSHKMVKYAMLIAEKYFAEGRKASWIKLYISPGFTFSKYYFIQLGFLDGWQGLASAYMTACYTFLKYARLKELNETS